MRQRDAMKSQVPGGVPGILPFVGHGNDVGVVKMVPLVIATTAAARCGGVGPGRIAFEPALTIVVVKLLAPEQSGERLAHDICAIGDRCRRESPCDKTHPLLRCRCANILSNVAVQELPLLAARLVQAAGAASMVSPGATVEA